MCDALRKLDCRKVQSVFSVKHIPQMIDRIVEIANPAELSVRLDQLVIATETAPPVSTPLSELGVLLIAHPRVTLTQAVISRIAANGGTVVTIDDAFFPPHCCFPSRPTTPIRAVCKADTMTLPLRKRLWKAIVQAKVRAQGFLLKELHGNDGGLIQMSGRVSRAIRAI